MTGSAVGKRKLEVPETYHASPSAPRSGSASRFSTSLRVVLGDGNDLRDQLLLNAQCSQCMAKSSRQRRSGCLAEAHIVD